MSDTNCSHCGNEYSSKRERIQHVLEEHSDEITSHERDSLKRERNKLEDSGDGGTSFSLRQYTKPLIGVTAILALIGVAFASGVIDFSAGGDSPSVDTGGDVSPGAPGTAHQHAQFDVVVDGDEVDFSQPRYQIGQTQNRYIHFEGGDGQTIHKHATDVTIEFALESLDMALEDGCLTLDTGEEYCEGNLTVQANGNSVNASTYVIQEGDSIEVSYDSG